MRRDVLALPREREGIHRAARRRSDGLGQQKYQLPRVGRSAGAKLQEAQELGVKIVDEAALKMLAGEGV